MSFRDRVLVIVKEIPKGSVCSYGEVAALAGSPGASRAVGNIMSKNRDPEVPCHRVIRKNGELGGYRDGITKKRRILTKEGALC